jgi:hypothetical protein
MVGSNKVCPQQLISDAEVSKVVLNTKINKVAIAASLCH